MDEVNDTPDVVEDTEEPEAEELAAPENETTDDKEARLKRLEENAIRQRERTRVLKAENEKLKKALTPKEVPQKQTDELSETQLDYLDLKGISNQEDIDVIQKVMKRTGQTVRQALADDYVTSKLAANKAKRDVQEATPSNTKRAGGQVGDVAAARAKFEATGELPADRELANAVVDSIAKADNDRLPPWQR